ncbi:hypothetical protein NMY22_g7033 [Coprinellus aureogranulatus]|nr:hypothetical protein NMY22_g7033 [Coprinellus aureogranulatus]
MRLVSFHDRLKVSLSLPSRYVVPRVRQWLFIRRLILHSQFFLVSTRLPRSRVFRSRLPSITNKRAWCMPFQHPVTGRFISKEEYESLTMTQAEELESLKATILELKEKNDELEAAAAATGTVPPVKQAPEDDIQTQKQINELRALAEELSKKVELNSSRLSAAGSGTGTGGIGTPYVPPASALGAGTSPSIRSLFPDVEAAHISDIISHTFRPQDLYKLDSRYRDKDRSYTFNMSTGAFETDNRAAKDYKSFDSIYAPLVTYFNILSAHLASRDRSLSVPFVFFQFLIHLQKIQREYEWAAVLEYTMIFVNRRRMEMLEYGDYSKWALPDTALMTEYVYAHKKAVVKNPNSSKSGSSSRVPVVCKNWNAGKCSETGKCPSGRSHVCSTFLAGRDSVPPQMHLVLAVALTRFRIVSVLATLRLRPLHLSVITTSSLPSLFLRLVPTLTLASTPLPHRRTPPPQSHTLIHIIRHGANLGFSGDKSHSQSCTNLKTAFESPSTTDYLSADIAAQVANERTHGPFLEPPFPNFRCSPLGAVSRKRSTKVRRIHHLSWPDGSSVNDGISDSEASINYDMVDKAITDLASSGRGSLMIKLDLESAFRHIPVRQADWHLLGFTWDGNFFYDVVLGFGCRSAPYIFNLFGEGLHWIIQRTLPAFIRHYLDDFLTIFKPGTPLYIVRAALDWMLALGAQLGLQFQPAKIDGPSTQLEFLGLELDSQLMEVRLPPTKLSYLSELLSEWSTMTWCTKRQIEELTGFLQFASQVIPTSRAFLRGFYNFAKGFASPFAKRRITGMARKDLEWWSSFAVSWNGIRFISPERETMHIYTDAAGTKGLGGHFGNCWYSERCPRRYRHEHIQVKEMLAVLHAVLRWGNELRRKHVIFHVDNEAIVSAINKLSIDSVPTMKILKSLISLACRLDFSFSSLWLSSSDNAIADAASRFSFTRMFELDHTSIARCPRRSSGLVVRNHSHLPKTVALYIWHGLASSTRKTYSTGQRRFIKYVQLHNLYNPDGSILPASQHAVMCWVASMGVEVQPKTIKAYLTAVRSLHVDADLPFTACESPIVGRLIRGIKIYHGERNRKPVQPITLPVLTALLGQLKPGVTPGHTSIYAACCVAYGGFLRSGEFTSGKNKSASLGLKRQHVQFLPSFEKPTHLILTLPASKTDPFRKGVSVRIAAAPGKPTCPVAALKTHFLETPDRAPTLH